MVSAGAALISATGGLVVGLVCHLLFMALVALWRSSLGAHSSALGAAISIASLASLGVLLTSHLGVGPELAVLVCSSAAIVSIDVLAPVGARTEATARLCAIALTAVAIRTPDPAIYFAAAAFALSAIAGLRPRHADMVSPALGRILRSASISILAFVVLTLLLWIGGAVPFMLLAALIGVASIILALTDLPTVAATGYADTRRALAFAAGSPAAEIDMNGRVVFANAKWPSAAGELPLSESLSSEWLALSADLVTVHLTGVPVQRRIQFDVGPAATGRRRTSLQAEISTGDPERSTCLISLREGVDLVTQAKIDTLQKEATTDSLTGLLNRRGLDEHIEQELQSCEVWVAYLDLNGFKAVNDALGHDSGDAVLVEIARRLRLVWRAEDKIARAGGDEFVVVTRSPISAETVQRCERALTFMAASFEISASMGVALGARGSDAAALVQQADIRMYDAKRKRKLGLADERQSTTARSRRYPNPNTR